MGVTYGSVFDIIGPIMVGPSSSHTAGALKIARVARGVLGKRPERANVTLFGSFAKTYKGHGTDAAIAAGLLGYGGGDPRVRDAVSAAKDAGIVMHFITSDKNVQDPNTVSISLKSGDESHSITGVSIGGGSITVTEVDGFRADLTGSRPEMLVFHTDSPGAIATVAGVVADCGVNISALKLSRKTRGGEALLSLGMDGPVSTGFIAEIRALGGVSDVKYIFIEDE